MDKAIKKSNSSLDKTTILPIYNAQSKVNKEQLKDSEEKSGSFWNSILSILPWEYARVSTPEPFDRYSGESIPESDTKQTGSNIDINKESIKESHSFASEEKSNAQEDSIWSFMGWSKSNQEPSVADLSRFKAGDKEGHGSIKMDRLRSRKFLIDVALWKQALRVSRDKN